MSHPTTRVLAMLEFLQTGEEMTGRALGKVRRALPAALRHCGTASRRSAPPWA